MNKKKEDEHLTKYLDKYTIVLFFKSSCNFEAEKSPEFSYESKNSTLTFHLSRWINYVELYAVSTLFVQAIKFEG